MLSPEEALKKLEYYCAYQERCHQEVIQKLWHMGVSKQEHDAMIARLIERDFLNETRFAVQFSGGKFRTKKWGKERIESALKARGISRWNIQHALGQIEENEYQTVFEQLFDRLFAKYQALPSRNFKRKKYTMPSDTEDGKQTEFIRLCGSYPLNRDWKCLKCRVF